MEIETKRVEFTLIKSDIKMTERQRDKIEFAIKLGDWGNFKDLISIELVGDVQERGFIVTVDQLNDNWHSGFSRVLCNKALLHDYRIYIKNERKLFQVNEI